MSRLVDHETSYCHLILTTGEDNCSSTKVKDLVDLNTLLNRFAPRFRCAILSYQAKDNQRLKEQLALITASCQNLELEEQMSFTQATKPSNVRQRLEQTAKWFLGLQDYSMVSASPSTSPSNARGFVPQELVIHEADADPQKRCVVLSLCLCDSLANDSHACLSLIEAVDSFVESLR